MQDRYQRPPARKSPTPEEFLALLKENSAEGRRLRAELNRETRRRRGFPSRQSERKGGEK